MQNTNQEQEIIHLSKEKWDYMSERNVDSLNALRLHEKALQPVDPSHHRAFIR